MRCPHCGAEVPVAKFCGACGKVMENTPPVAPQQPGYQQQQGYYQQQQGYQPQPGYQQQAAAYQPGYQPGPMAMPPRKKPGHVWLWVGLGALAVVILTVGGLLLSSRDDGGTTDNGGKTVASGGAVATMQSYLDARKTGNDAAAYALVSPKARESYTQAEFASAFQKIVSYGKLEATSPQENWYRVTIHDLAYEDVTFPTLTWTVAKVDGKYYVAMETPLADKIDAAYNAKQYDDVLKLADQELAINPFSYDAYYNRGWAYNDTDKPADAIKAFTEAGKYVPPSDTAELARSLGSAYGRNKQWDLAVGKMEEALKQAAQYPKLWDADWLRQTKVDLVTSYQNKGDTVKAHDLLEQLYKENPATNNVGSKAVTYERNAYKVENGMATYRLFLRGVTFALPQDWIVSSETTGGDWWFARHPKTPQGRDDFAVYFWDPKSGGNTLDEFAAYVLNWKQNPIGAPKQAVNIVAKQNITVGGKPALQVAYSTGSISVLVRSQKEWVDFEWYNNDVAKASFNQWLPTVKVD